VSLRLPTCRELRLSCVRRAERWRHWWALFVASALRLVPPLLHWPSHSLPSSHVAASCFCRRSTGCARKLQTLLPGARFLTSITFKRSWSPTQTANQCFCALLFQLWPWIAHLLNWRQAHCWPAVWVLDPLRYYGCTYRCTQMPRFLYSRPQGTVGVAVFGTQWFLNRETRGGLSPVEQSYLHSVRFGVLRVCVKLIYRRPSPTLVEGLFWQHSLLGACSKPVFLVGSWLPIPVSTFPAHVVPSWLFAGLVLGVSLVGSIGTMMGAMYTSPENTVQKHLFWGVRVLCSVSNSKAKFIPGLQPLPSSNSQPFIFPAPGAFSARGPVHLRCRRLPRVCRCNSQVSTEKCAAFEFR